MSSPIKLEIEGKKYVAYPEQSEGEKKRSLRPENGQGYSLLIGSTITFDSWGSRWSENEQFKLGNVFSTLREAERELAYRQALQRVKEWIYEHDAGKEWSKDPCWLVRWYEGNFDTYCPYAKFFSPFGYLKSEEACEQLIREMDSDLRIIFNV